VVAAVLLSSDENRPAKPLVPFLANPQ